VSLSIVIPTCNRPELLRLCLDSLLPQVQQSGNAVEVIVTDDSREGETLEMLEAEFAGTSVRRVLGPRRGPAANRNHGAAEATGEWVLFLDDDCIPSDGFLRAYLRDIEIARR